MVKHIVCFKLSNNSENNCKLTQNVLLSMRGKVPVAISVDANIDQLHTARSYDIILEVVLESWEKLEEYQSDPYHCNIVKKHMHSVTETSIALDFEI